MPKSDKERSGGLQRKTPLRSSTPLRRTPLRSEPKRAADGNPIWENKPRQSKPLKQGAPLKRGTPMKQGKGLQRKTPLRSNPETAWKNNTGSGLRPSPGGLAPSRPDSTQPPRKQGTEIKRKTPLKSSPPKQSAPQRKKPISAGARSPQRSAPIKSKPRPMSAEERLTRALVSDRSQGLCEKCGTSKPLEKAHRIGRGVGGKWTPANILDLCHDCHHGHHATPAEAYEHGWHLRSTQDPLRERVLIRKDGRYDWAFLDDEGGWAWCSPS